MEELERKLTTLKDGYEVRYYPQTVANVVHRQFKDETVETSLQRLEYIREHIYEQDKGTVNDLLSYDPTTYEFRKSGLKVYLEQNNKLYFQNGDFLVSSAGDIHAWTLNLQGTRNQIGALLTIQNDGTVGHRTLEEVLLDLKAAPLESPHLTGIPTAPTASFGTSTSQIASTEFVQEAVERATHNWGFIKLDVNKWSEELDEFYYYTQKIEMNGMLEEYKPIFNLIVSNYRLEAAEKEGFFNLASVTTYDGYVIARTQVKPNVDIFLDVRGV